jgi:hypothetical protein
MNAKRILEAVKLFKGVKSVSVATEEQIENLSILKACKSARKTEKVSKEEILEQLQ